MAVGKLLNESVESAVVTSNPVKSLIDPCGIAGNAFPERTALSESRLGEVILVTFLPSISQVALVFAAASPIHAVGPESVLKIRDVQLPRQTLSPNRQGCGYAGGVPGGDAIAHALACRGRDMCGRNASPSNQKAVNLLRQDRAVRYVVDLHLGESNEANIQEAASPRDYVVKFSASERVLFSQDVRAFHTARLSNTDLSTRSD